MTHPEHPVDPNLTDDLAALYALDLLDDDDQALVDQAMAEDAGFVQQVDEFQAAAATLAYSVPTMPMTSNLKARLFQRIAQEPDVPDSPFLALLKRSINDLKQQAAELNWEQMMGTNAAEMAIWQTDEDRREVAFFVRKSAGGLFPNHAHAGGETVLVLEGDFVANGQIYGVGELANSMANTAHQPSTQAGCLLLCISSMDDEVLS